MNRSRLRSIPAVDKILRELGDTGLPHPIVVDLVRRELAVLRKRKAMPNSEELLARMHETLRHLRASRIQPVINGTGILIHTNFGRAPLGASAIQAVTIIGSNYSNLEYGLTSGSRGGRAAYLEKCLALLCGAEAATVVNNNAAALVLILSHLCKAVPPIAKRRASHRGKNNEQGPKNEVIISRGELIQIGGGFRIPEIVESSGARLREVGTTNKTSLDDYARAVGRDTALILKVHRSNFYMGGFVESPRTDEIAKLARKSRIPFVEDLGSGAIMNTQSIAGLEHEPTPGDLVRSGLDLICFSADKLFGGPQAGIIAGSAGEIAALKQEPIFRALRCDKLIFSALEATADLYLRSSHNGTSLGEPGGTKQATRGRTALVAGIPVLEMLHVSIDDLRARADKIMCALRESPVSAVAGTGTAQVGGGTLPCSVLPSITVDLTHNRFKAQELAARLRERSLPIIGYVARGTLKLDLRTIFPSQDAELVKALQEL